MEGPLDLFISYVPEDDDLRKELEEHLALLKRDRVIRAWHQRLMGAGSDFRRETGERLHSARVVVVLVSASYLASDRYDEELQPALARGRKGATLVLPVLARAHDGAGAPFSGLTPLPGNKLPVTSWANRDEAWADVASGIREAIEALGGKRSNRPAEVGNNATEPRYEESASRMLAKQIEAARTRRKALLEAKVSTADVDGEILDLRRRLRDGGRLRAGDTLEDGRYLLIELVGRGGFASVWSAVDREREERVAIKVLHAEMARDESRRDRFFRGARVMAGLGHEAVVRVLSPRGDDGGWLYFVMELVTGGDLHRAVVKRVVTREQALPIILGVGEALAEAHAKGIVHRDVKPGNILLDASGAPKLTDFDLVSVDDTTGGTRTSAHMGTYLFMAPEQSSNAKSADARADVYGLGMTVMFCLHGGELPEITLRRPDRVIERLSCSGAVKAVLTRAIELNPAERFADARAFCEALQDAANEQGGRPPQRERVSDIEEPRMIEGTSRGDGSGYGAGSAGGSGRGDGSGYGAGSAGGSGRGDGSGYGAGSADGSGTPMPKYDTEGTVQASQRPGHVPPAQPLSELKNAAEAALSVKERTRAIEMVGLRGGQSEIPWLTAFAFRSKRKATLKATIEQIAALGGIDAVRSLKDIADNHKHADARVMAAELLPRLDKLSDPEWFKYFLRKNQAHHIKYRLLDALAEEGWSHRLDMSASHVRQFIEDLRQLAEVEQHPDVRHNLISIVAHLRKKDESREREWVFQKAMESAEGYYRIRTYAIGLSVWNDDVRFVQALNECSKDDSTGSDGKMFVYWAKEGDWKRYRFHMGGWGPKM